MAKSTLASAPGKVLIAGGYLVLDPAYPGLVVSTDSRFYSYVQTSQDAPENTITVTSPQFVDAQWVYRASLHGEEEWVLQQTADSRKQAGSNPFVSLALLYTLRLASELHGVEEVRSQLSPNGLHVRVLGDNDFYSQRSTLNLTGTQTPTVDLLSSLPPFTKQSCRISDVHKTGLGSSAAMTTSLVGSLWKHLGGEEEGDLALVHNLAQLAHCAAQGKVGSGFDVSAAVWGSQLYRRFDPSVIQECLDEGEKVGVEGDAIPDLTRRKALLPVLDPRNPLWQPSPGASNPTAVEGLALSTTEEAGVPRPAPVQLPPGIDMVLADVDAGSNTPSLVGKVLEWRKTKREWADQLYAVLSASNQSLADGLLQLRLMAAQDPKVYQEALQAASAVPNKEWDGLAGAYPAEEQDGELKTTPRSVLETLIYVRQTLRAVRMGMRELGQRSGAPVEPKEMGTLIHGVCETVPGLLGGGVPGAGGYDALYLLYIAPTGKPDQPRLEVEKYWQSMAQEEQQGDVKLNVGPLLSRAGLTPLPTEASSDPLAALQKQHAITSGLRIEQLESIKGLREAISQ